jgi:hypothetical protein
MELRNHPKMKWQGSPNWPPQWNGPHGPDNPLPNGEVGVLKSVEKSVVSPVGACCLLVIGYNDQDYFASLSLDDRQFSNKLCAILSSQIGSLISAIGNLDIL